MGIGGEMIWHQHFSICCFTVANIQISTKQVWVTWYHYQIWGGIIWIHLFCFFCHSMWRMWPPKCSNRCICKYVVLCISKLAKKNCPLQAKQIFILLLGFPILLLCHQSTPAANLFIFAIGQLSPGNVAVPGVKLSSWKQTLRGPLPQVRHF